jgi:hypothetical protein
MSNGKGSRPMIGYNWNGWDEKWALAFRSKKTEKCKKKPKKAWKSRTTGESGPKPGNAAS